MICASSVLGALQAVTACQSFHWGQLLAVKPYPLAGVPSGAERIQLSSCRPEVARDSVAGEWHFDVKSTVGEGRLQLAETIDSAAL